MVRTVQNKATVAYEVARIVTEDVGSFWSSSVSRTAQECVVRLETIVEEDRAAKLYDILADELRGTQATAPVDAESIGLLPMLVMQKFRRRYGDALEKDLVAVGADCAVRLLGGKREEWLKAYENAAYM